MLSTIRAEDMKFYLYRSKAKIEMLYEQVVDPKKKQKIKWKLEAKPISRESETDDSEVTLEEKLQRVLRELDDEEQIGSLEDNKPYIRATLLMRWGMYNDYGYRDDASGPLVYFGSTDDQLLFGMGGSSNHIKGMYGLGSTSSRSVTPVLVNFLLCGLRDGERQPDYLDADRSEMEHTYEAMALANHYLRGPVQNLEFVAKLICRDQNCKLRPWRSERGDGILATPLYVSQIDPMEEDDDPPPTTNS
ncbi:MAG: SAVMC3_10250 family protein, partial [Bryobacteraceae bacterium]